MNSLRKLKNELQSLANPAKAKILQGFFKTGEGQYGEGDIFLGIVVPQQRAIAKKYADSLTLEDMDKLIKSKIHEERLIALLILVDQFISYRRHPEPKLVLRKGRRIFIKNQILQSPEKMQSNSFRMTQENIYKFYLSHTAYINNWDLADLSAPKILGAYLRDKNKSILYKLVKSKNIWERRIAIIATFDFIRQGRYEDTIAISKLLLGDTHDLIHKATGWMLREVGKHCGEEHLLNFLDQHAAYMPRTMLRYAIERLPEKIRKKYLSRRYKA